MVFRLNLDVGGNMKIFNKTLPKDIVEELQYLDEAYFPFDEPVPLTGNLKLYPVNVRYHDEFLTCSACMTLNRMDDINGIKRDNIGYLIYKMEDEKEGAKWSRYFSRLCELVFNIKNGIKCQKCGKVFDFRQFFEGIKEKGNDFRCECGELSFSEVIGIRENKETKKKELHINGNFISSKDFDRMRQIVMYQNLPDYKDDSYVDIEVRKDQEETRALRAKKNRMGSASLERKMVCLSVKTGFFLEDIYKLTIRKFLMMFSAVDDLINYETARIGLMTGVVSTKEPLEHWVYKNDEEDIYGRSVDAGAFKDMINGANN